MFKRTDTLKVEIVDELDCRPVDEIAHPDLKAMLALWQRVRGERPFAARTDMTPRDMKSYLTQVHVYDVVDSGRDFRLRLQGSSLTRRDEPNPIGKLLSEYPHPQLGARLIRICRAVFEGRAPLHVTADHHSVTDLPGSLHVDSLWLPLGTGESIDSIIAQSVMKLQEDAGA